MAAPHASAHDPADNLAAERLGLKNTDCVVIEDSLVGLRAAYAAPGHSTLLSFGRADDGLARVCARRKGAGMPCLITYTASTASEDFYGEGAAAKVPDLGVGVTLEALFDVPAGAVLPELASSVRDPRS